MTHFYLLILIGCIDICTVLNIKAELKQNILNFGYGINFKYEGMLSHSFDRFYVVTKFELPKVEDLLLTMVPYDSKCEFIDLIQSTDHNTYHQHQKLLTYCNKIFPYVEIYKRQIAYYNRTAYDLLTKEIGLILLTFEKETRHKCSIIGAIVSEFIGLAYKGILSYLHHRHQNTLNKAMNAMQIKVNIKYIKIQHLEDTMIMHGVYNSITLEQLIETVHEIHERLNWQEKTFVGTINEQIQVYLNSEGVNHFAINS